MQETRVSLHIYHVRYSGLTPPPILLPPTPFFPPGYPLPICSITTSPQSSSSLESHLLLDLGDRQTGVEALGACAGAVEDGVAAVQAHRVVEGVLALGRPLVARVDQPPVRLEQDGGAQVLLRVPPVRGARRRAARAEDALVEAVELLSVRLALPVLLALLVWVSASSLAPVPDSMRAYMFHLRLLLVCPFADTA